MIGKFEIENALRREGINATVRYAVVYPARAGWYAFSISFAGDESRGEAALRRLYNVMRTDGLWLLRKRSQTIGLVTAGGTHTPPTPPIPPVPPTPTSPDYLSFTARKAGATLRMLGSVNENNTYILPQLEYSDDGGETWNTLNFTDGEQTDSEYARVSDTLTFSEVGDTVLFRGNCPDGTVHWTVIDEDFIFYFSGGENTQQEDNVFSVGGNLQTLVDGTGESTTAPCFAELFRCDGILIDSAPDLPATTLSDYSYAAMFLGQTMLTTPANMGALTNASLPHVDLQAPAETYSMYGMYLDSALATMPSLPGIVIDENTSLQELYDVVLGIYMFVSGCPVVVTDDNGLTFNGLTGFDCSAETMAHLAQLIGADSELSTFFFANNIYGNVNGFAKSIINVKSDNGEIDVESLPGTYYGERYIWIKDGVSQQVTLTDHISNGYHFVKWMTRASENDQWVDDTQHLTDTFTFTAVPGSEYHYKAVDAEYVIHVDLDGISGYTGASYTDGNGDNQTAINVFPVNIPLQYCNLYLTAEPPADYYVSNYKVRTRQTEDGQWGQWVSVTPASGMLATPLNIDNGYTEEWVEVSAEYEPLTTILFDNDNGQSDQPYVVKYYHINGAESQFNVPVGGAWYKKFKPGTLLTFTPASIDDNGTTRYLAINGTVGTTYTVTTDDTIIVTFI